MIADGNTSSSGSIIERDEQIESLKQIIKSKDAKIQEYSIYKSKFEESREIIKKFEAKLKEKAQVIADVYNMFGVTKNEGIQKLEEIASVIKNKEQLLLNITNEIFDEFPDEEDIFEKIKDMKLQLEEQTAINTELEEQNAQFLEDKRRLYTILKSTEQTVYDNAQILVDSYQQYQSFQQQLSSIFSLELFSVQGVLLGISKISDERNQLCDRIAQLEEHHARVCRLLQIDDSQESLTEKINEILREKDEAANESVLLQQQTNEVSRILGCEDDDSHVVERAAQLVKDKDALEEVHSALGVPRTEDPIKVIDTLKKDANKLKDQEKKIANALDLNQSSSGITEQITGTINTLKGTNRELLAYKARICSALSINQSDSAISAIVDLQQENADLTAALSNEKNKASRNEDILKELCEITNSDKKSVAEAVRNIQFTKEELHTKMARVCAQLSINKIEDAPAEIDRLKKLIRSAGQSQSDLLSLLTARDLNEAYMHANDLIKENEEIRQNLANTLYEAGVRKLDELPDALKALKGTNDLNNQKMNEICEKLDVDDFSEVADAIEEIQKDVNERAEQMDEITKQLQVNNFDEVSDAINEKQNEIDMAKAKMANAAETLGINDFEGAREAISDLKSELKSFEKIQAELLRRLNVETPEEAASVIEGMKEENIVNRKLQSEICEQLNITAFSDAHNVIDTIQKNQGIVEKRANEVCEQLGIVEFSNAVKAIAQIQQNLDGNQKTLDGICDALEIHKAKEAVSAINELYDKLANNSQTIKLIAQAIKADPLNIISATNNFVKETKEKFSNLSMLLQTEDSYEDIVKGVKNLQTNLEELKKYDEELHEVLGKNNTTKSLLQRLDNMKRQKDELQQIFEGDIVSAAKACDAENQKVGEILGVERGSIASTVAKLNDDHHHAVTVRNEILSMLGQNTEDKDEEALKEAVQKLLKTHAQLEAKEAKEYEELDRVTNIATALYNLLEIDDQEPLEATVDSLKELLKERRELNTEIKEMQDELNSIQNALGKAASESPFAETITEIRKECRLRGRLIESMKKADIDKTNCICEALQISVNSSTDEIRDAIAAYKIRNESLITRLSEILSLDTEHQSITDICMAVKQKCTAVTDLMDAMKKQPEEESEDEDIHRECEERIDGLAARVREMHAQMTEMNESNIQKDAEISRIESMLNAVYAELGIGITTPSEAVEAIAELRSEIEKLKRTIAKMQNNSQVNQALKSFKKDQDILMKMMTDRIQDHSSTIKASLSAVLQATNNNESKKETIAALTERAARNTERILDEMDDTPVLAEKPKRKRSNDSPRKPQKIVINDRFTRLPSDKAFVSKEGEMFTKRTKSPSPAKSLSREGEMAQLERKYINSRKHATKAQQNLQALTGNTNNSTLL